MKTDQSQHPTFVHELVWWEGISLTPLEMSLAGLKTDDPALLESCESLHGFFAELLEDMYQHPDAYYLNAGEYESFLNGKSEFEARRENKKKHNNARSKCYSLTGFHQLFLMEVSRCGEVIGDRLVVNSALKVVGTGAVIGFEPVIGIFVSQEYVVLHHSFQGGIGGIAVVAMGDHEFSGWLHPEQFSEIAEQHPFPNGVKLTPAGDTVNISCNLHRWKF